MSNKVSQSAGGACSNLNEFVNQYQYVGVSTETEHLPEKISIDAGAVINIGLNGDSMAQILYSRFGRIAVRGYAVWDNLKWTPWMILATTTPPQVYDLPLAEGITNIVNTMSKYWMNQDSTVHVEISVQAASELADESLVATLPEGFLPAESQPRYIGNDAFLTIQTGGEIQLFLRGGGSLPAGRWICAEFNYRLSLQM